MKLVLSHSTALDMIRAYRCGAPFELIRTRATSLADSAHTKEQISRFEIPAFPRTDGRLHVLVPSTSMVCRSKSHISHLASFPLPAGSLMQLSQNVFAASPSLVFVQYGATLPWLQLTLLGCELCGKYSLPPVNQFGMAKCAPLVHANDLARYVDRLPRARGATAAKQALQWVPDFSASPMESAIYLLLVLPVRRGGYGLTPPDMNPPTSLRARSARVMGIDELHCDLHWREAHVALEYNSKDAHIGQLTRDARRSNVLNAEGEHVFVMTPAILASPEECDILVGQIAHALGHRLQGNAVGRSAKRMELRTALFPWIARDRPNCTG